MNDLTIITVPYNQAKNDHNDRLAESRKAHPGARLIAVPVGMEWICEPNNEQEVRDVSQKLQKSD